MKRIPRQFLALILNLTVLLFVFATPAAAQTSAWSGVCVQSHQSPAGTTNVATIQGFQCLIANVLSVAIQFIGLAGFVMMIIGAFRYMLSGGNSKGAEAARNTVTYAIVGLIVALSSFIILNLLSAFTGVETILNFSLIVSP